MVTANYSELRSNLKSCLDRVVENNEHLVVHRSGNRGVVVISLDEYNAMKETAYIMKSPAMVARLKEAEKEMQEGKGKAIDIEDLWK